VCRIPRLPLGYGQYGINAFVGISDVASDRIDNAATLFVEPGDFFGTGEQGIPEWCPVLIDCEWSVRS
jgi:lipopolysaccharide transport system ATP-binding protein